MPPTFANGKICYIEVPATDIARSSNFYKQVFGWNIRKRGDGSTSFDDTVGEVSGTWVLGRPPGVTPGLLFYLMVDSVASTIDAIVAKGRNPVPSAVSFTTYTLRYNRSFWVVVEDLEKHWERGRVNGRRHVLPPGEEKIVLGAMRLGEGDGHVHSCR